MIEKYRALMSAVELGSLTRAAEALGCTQSAVSHAIASLEQELGFRLLLRARSGIRLTDEGERMLPAVRSLLSAGEQLEQTAASIRGLDQGTVRIGAFTSVAVHWLPAVLKEFQHDYPHVSFRLLNGDYHDVSEWLADGSVDIGFVALPCERSCRRTAALRAIRAFRSSSASASRSSRCCRAPTTTRGGRSTRRA